MAYVLDPAIKTQWVAALRSGKYAQGQQCLYDPDTNTYCCLGVLEQLFLDSHGWGWEVDEEIGIHRGSDEFPSYGCRDWAFPDAQAQRKINNDDSITKGDKVYYRCIDTKLGDTSLYELNDSCHTFDYIANIIEEQF